MALTRGSTEALNSSATSLRSSLMGGVSGRELDEGQRLRGPELDRVAALGEEGLAVEDQVRAFAMDGDLVDFLEVDAAHLLAPVTARDAGEHCPKHRSRALLNRDNLQWSAALAPKRVGQQQLLQRRHRQEGELARI